jgi:hypothetical protein
MMKTQRPGRLTEQNQFSKLFATDNGNVGMAAGAIATQFEARQPASGNVSGNLAFFTRPGGSFDEQSRVGIRYSILPPSGRVLTILSKVIHISR